jgi:hypothetical protein
MDIEICGVIESNVFVLNSGEEFSFTVNFKDNIALSQYKIDIHQNFDCHGHGDGAVPALSLPPRENATEDWFLIVINDLEGKEQTRQFTLSVPENVTAGNYHFSVQVLDEAGNDTQEQDIFNLKVYNTRDTIPPSIDLESPLNKTLTLKRGDSIAFKGKVEDNINLGEGGNGMIFLSYRNLSSGNLFATQTFEVFTLEQGTRADFNLIYTVPSFLNRGPYRFSLNAFDGVRNTAFPLLFDVEIE